VTFSIVYLRAICDPPPFSVWPVDSKVASNCVAMRSYSRIKCEGHQLCTSALLNDVWLRTVSKEEGLFTCRAKHVISRISVT